MTLQELLRKGNFDWMFDYIVKFDPKQKGTRFCYQAAYASLCDMEAEAGREYDVVPNPYAKEKEEVAFPLYQASAEQGFYRAQLP